MKHNLIVEFRWGWYVVVYWSWENKIYQGHWYHPLRVPCNNMSASTRFHNPLLNITSN